MEYQYHYRSSAYEPEGLIEVAFHLHRFAAEEVHGVMADHRRQQKGPPSREYETK